MEHATDPVEGARSEHTVTLHVPELLYDHIRRTAETQKRPLEEVLLDAVGAALPPLSGLPREVADDVAALPFLNDAALWQVARSTPPAELHDEMEALLAGKGRGELSDAEQRRLDDLVHVYEVSALRRAQAALLLQRRGYDMSDPAVLSPLP
jgi:hypothetical protein